MAVKKPASTGTGVRKATEKTGPEILQFTYLDIQFEVPKATVLDPELLAALERLNGAEDDPMWLVTAARIVTGENYGELIKAAKNVHKDLNWFEHCSKVVHLFVEELGKQAPKLFA